MLFPRRKMGIYKYLGKLWKQPREGLGPIWKEHMIKWRREPVTVRLDRPTRLDRAHALGYKAKLGIFVVRQRVSAGSHRRPDFAGGRRPKHFHKSLVLSKNYQLVSEERANKKFSNCEVLNSYYVGGDSKHFWYEVILVDRSHPSVRADHRTAWVTKPGHRGRVFRGRTSAGRKIRGLWHKGKGAEHLRPSRSSRSRELRAR